MSVLSRISVYYDGLCPLCSKEIAHYRKQKGQEYFYFIDITAPEFQAQAEGLDPFLIHKVMHVKTAEGEIKTGLDAFITIWDNLPKYFWMGRISKIAFVKPLLRVGYYLFAKLRPYLPRKSRDCENSPYCETRKI